MTIYTEKVIEIILSLEPGMVASFGSIATMAGNSGGARQVSRILHSCAEKYNLPWWRVISSSGRLPGHRYRDLQREMLISEGVVVDEACRVVVTDT
jgi:methylated-DNA-protein-cysteine methyltransferase-like protein